MSRRVTAALLVFVCALASPRHARAQAGPPDVPRSDSSRPFEIVDNSFFVEEAFNQEAGVFQNIFGGALLQNTGWAATFTQEWPVPGMRHQLSYTVPVSRVNGSGGLGDLALNYRYQLQEEGPGRPAIAPRLSLLCPTGDAGAGLGAGAWGLQVNVPVSKQVHDVYLHGNAGLTWYPRVTSPIPGGATSAGAFVAVGPRALASPFLSGSAIYRLRPMFHLMLESVFLWQDQFVAPGETGRTLQRIVSPGARGGWNHGDTQYVLGAALPVTWNPSSTDVGVFLYFSYETAFRKPHAP